MEHSSEHVGPTDPFTMVAQTQLMMSRILEQLGNQENRKKDGKVDIKALPTFHGIIGQDNVDKFIDLLNRAFAAFDITSDARKIYYAANQLRGTASNWYFAQRRIHGDAWEQQLTWPYFVSLLTTQFKPVDFDLLLRDKLDRLRQTSSVDAYTNVFMDTVSQLPDMSEKDKLHRYLRGLKERTAAHVRAAQPASLQRAIDLATTYDHAVFQQGGPQRNRAVPRPHPAVHTDSMEIDNIRVQQKSRPSFSPAGQRFRHQNSTRVSNDCFKCGKPGHFARDCRSRPQHNQQENDKSQ
jgi:Ty3 transposon capsid-like protein/Zinc knuckle